MKSIIKWMNRTGFIILSLLIGSCEIDPSPNSTQIETIQNEATSGLWIISKFEDSGKDETNDFAGYVFVFLPSGSVTATKGGTIYSGNWSITNSSGSNSSQDDLDFNIFFNLTNEFEDLNDDWEIVSHSSTRIELKDVSGGSGGIDYLTFVKQ
jgi:hypothetical protein